MNALRLNLFTALVALVFSSNMAWSQDEAVVDSTTTDSIVAVEAPAEVAPAISKADLSGDIFKNISTKAKPEGVVVYWTIDYPVSCDKIVDEVVIKYCTKIESKKDDPEWSYTAPIDAHGYKHEIADLSGKEKYVFKIGFAKEGNIAEVKGDKEKMAWSSKGKFTTERAWGLAKLLILIGALGFFIFGMKMMSEGIQKAAGQRLRNTLGSMTSNRVKGVISGFFITSFVQSSSATTVMTVSLVNAGLLTLVQSAGIMMGANIGTTITGWLVSFFGFKVSLSSYALMIIAIGAPMMFVRNAKVKAWAQTFIGFAILFWGLGELKGAVPSLDAESAIVQFFTDYKNTPFLGPIMFVLLGALVTIVVQSSSAAMALTLTLVVGGVIPFEVAAAMILGENIGTTITAELASLIGNVHAKRSARIHSMFNIVGVTWMIFLIPFFLRGISAFLQSSGIITADPFAETAEGYEAATIGLAAFHTTFNFLNVILLIWFVPLLVKLAIKTVKSRGDADEEFKLDYIGMGVMGTPELSILEAKKEVAKFGKITGKMAGYIHTLINDPDKKAKNKLYNKIEKYEEITDRVEIEIASFLGKVSESELSPEASVRMRGMLNISTDLERIGDIFFQMSKTIERKEAEKIWFTQDQRDGLNKMIKHLEEAFDIMNTNLNAEYGQISMDQAREKERVINQFRNELRTGHLKDMENQEFNIKAGMIYNDLFSSCEKIGDHIINVSEAVAGEF